MTTPVTPETLTDEMIAGVEREAVGRLYLDCLDATVTLCSQTAAPEAMARWHSARQRICDAINARRAKEQP